MRMISLLITLLVLAYVVYAQLVKDVADVPISAPQRMEQHAEEVKQQMEQALARQAAELGKKEAEVARQP